MKQLLFIVLFTSSGFIFSQTSLPYSVAEYTSYRVSFGGISVGYANLEIKEVSLIKNTPIFHIIGKGRTSPFFDWFFKVRDVYETFIDTTTLLPLEFKRAVNEGGYLINQHYRFNHKQNNVLAQDSIFIIPSNTQDMLSAFFYARTFKKDSVIISGNSFYIPIFMDEENYLLEIKYQKNEVLNTKFGKVDCMVFKPKMQEGRVFENGEEMKIWISDDANHLLVKVETKIWAGTIKAVLDDYKEIKYPLSIIGE
tara:strand:+ start:377 stop:1135 length:759 start_codon:yes stop_codon:yes gene_type:complete